MRGGGGRWSNNNVQIDENDVLGSGLLFCFCSADLDSSVVLFSYLPFGHLYY